MTLRIAHVTATFPPYRGGTGNVCFHNARELARRGHDIHVFTAAVSGAPAYEQREGFTVHRLRPLIRVGNAPVLPELLHKLRGFDVIHLHYPFFGGELTALAARISNVPLVVTYHQDVFLHGVMGLIERSLRYTIGRWALRSATRLLFTSDDYGRASYMRPLLRGREQAIDALPNGVDTQTFRPAVKNLDLCARHNLRSDDQVVLLVAGLDRAHYFKGVTVLIDALAMLPPHVKAVIVGDGDLRSEYQAHAAHIGMQERVIFAGRVAEEMLPDYYCLADVTVLPSTTMGEAFGLVLVESLACGTPVVATNLPGVRTVVDHEIDGLLVEPSDVSGLANALGRLLKDSPLRIAMGLDGRAKTLERYDWQRIGEQLEAIYFETLYGVPQAQQTPANEHHAASSIPIKRGV